MKALPVLAMLSLTTLAGCESAAERQADATEDRIERQAEASAAAAGATPAALGLSEAQLLNADLVGADGAELGDVQQVRRTAGGTVEGLVVEIESSNPDRYVLLPLAGLKTRIQGDDADLQTTMTAAELAKLPDALAPAS